MKSFVVLCLLAVAAAAPPDVSLVRYENNNDFSMGSYNYAFEQSDGTKQESLGTLKNEGKDDAFFAVTGSFAWVGPDGVTYIIKYTADENGYKPEIDQGPGGAVPPGVVASLLG